MAKKNLKKSIPSADIIKPYISVAIKYSPIWAPILITLIFALVVVQPSLKKIAKLKRDIKEKKDYITTGERGKFDVEKIKEELEDYRLKAKEFDKRLPEILKTNLLIETLQEITKESDLKFSSLEPASVKKHVIKETNDVFVELPIKITLKCGYYELINFIKKIENAEQLMKITSLSIKDDASQDWQHNVEFVISAFSKGKSDD